MELQLGLDIPTPLITKGFDLNNFGFDQLKEMRGTLKACNICIGGCFGDNDCVKKKRGFEQAFGNFTDDCKAKPLLLWSGQPNEEEDDHKDQKKRTSSSTIDDRIKDAEEDQVVGWPPIKSWRKKILHQQQHQVGNRIDQNNRAADEKEINGRSIYVKVKMEGIAIARKIDIRLYHSYQALTNSLITIFAKHDYNTRYTLTYQDKEGDWLIAGDIPWETFIRSVQRLEIVRNWG
ncbi:hypothetical protein REPUB_Repub18cG0160400 [Reevesia pubescens]